MSDDSRYDLIKLLLTSCARTHTASGAYFSGWHKSRRRLGIVSIRHRFDISRCCRRVPFAAHNARSTRSKWYLRGSRIRRIAWRSGCFLQAPANRGRWKWRARARAQENDMGERRREEAARTAIIKSKSNYHLDFMLIKSQSREASWRTGVAIPYSAPHSWRSPTESYISISCVFVLWANINFDRHQTRENRQLKRCRRCRHENKINYVFDIHLICT